MITGFKKQTAPLTAEEKKIKEYVVRRLKLNNGASSAVTSKKIIQAIKKQFDLKRFGGARLRKIINRIRVKGEIKGLVASSSGYYVETNPELLRAYIRSLRERAEAIEAVAKALEKQF